MKRSLFFCLILSLSPIFPFAGEKAQRNLSHNATQLKVLTWNVQMLPSLGAHFNKNLKKMQKEEVLALKMINRKTWDKMEDKRKMIKKTKRIWKWVMIRIITSTMFMMATINECICSCILFNSTI